MNHCSCHHFPSNLSSVATELKTKLKNWVNSQPLVEWHGEAISWINPGTDSGTSRTVAFSGANGS